MLHEDLSLRTRSFISKR